MKKKLDSRILDEIVGPPYGRWLEIRENGVDELVRAGMLPSTAAYVTEDSDRRVFEEHAPNIAPFVEQALRVPFFSSEAEARKMVHLGSPWNAALTFKKKSGRLPPRKKSSAHSQFQADSSY